MLYGFPPSSVQGGKTLALPTSAGVFHLSLVRLLLVPVRSMFGLDVVDRGFQRRVIRDTPAFGELQSVLGNAFLLLFADVVPVSGYVGVVTEDGTDLLQRTSYMDVSL